MPEWHKSHGLHLHFALNTYVRRGLIREAWNVPDAGFVHIKLLSDLPTGSGRADEARAAAGYLSKYVGKSFTADRISHLKRYDVAEGFQPERRRFRGRSSDEVMSAAEEIMGRPPTYVWSSNEVEDWPGAPALSVRWS